jgi:hypothetical protein
VGLDDVAIDELDHAWSVRDGMAARSRARRELATSGAFNSAEKEILALL